MKITTMNLEVDIMTLVLKLIAMKTGQMNWGLRDKEKLYINQLKSDLKRHQKLLKEHHETKQEITIKPFDNDGNLVDYNVRADEITNYFFNEVKASDTAPYTQNQKNGGMIRGKGKDGFLGGTILGPLKGYTTRNGITRSILDDMNLIGGN